jgi:hypothetical protein
MLSSDIYLMIMYGIYFSKRIFLCMYNSGAKFNILLVWLLYDSKRSIIFGSRAQSSNYFSVNLCYYNTNHLYEISVRDGVNPGAIVQLEGLGKLKNSMTSLITEPTNFRL